MRTLPYPSRDMIAKVPEMSLIEVKARHLQVWFVLTTNKELLQFEEYDYTGFDNLAPEYITDYIRALAERAELLGYDITQDIAKFIGKHSKTEDVKPSDFED